MLKSRRPERVVDGEVLLHSSNVNLEAVLARLGADIELLKNAHVVCEGGLFKLVIPGESAEDEKLTVLVLKESELENARGLEVKLSKAADEVGYEDEASEAVVAVATKLMAEAYINKKRIKNPQSQPFIGTGKCQRNGGLIENVQMAMVRPLNVFSERGLQAAKDISIEHWEGLVLEAMAVNDEKRMNYLARQAARVLETTGAMGIDGDWRELYQRSMEAELGFGNYPTLDTRQGLEIFMNKVYFPVVAALLSAAEIASTMGDNQAVMTTALLKSQMEIELATQAANTAEKVQPAKARSEMARVRAEAGVAAVLEQHSDVLMVAKRMRARLVAATVATPVLHATSEVLEVGSEAAPAVFKGFAEYLDRWLRQKDADPKLVGITSGGLAVGIVLAFFVSPWLLLATPTAAAAAYMAVKGFRTHAEDE